MFLSFSDEPKTDSNSNMMKNDAAKDIADPGETTSNITEYMIDTASPPTPVR